MCGIAGALTPGRAAPRDTVARMVREMRHRGPDGEYLWSERDVALGMRRLAIVDVEDGVQPLTNETRTVSAVFNGEIYNHGRLRERLAANCHRFRSRTDGEVIPHLYEELGVDFVSELRGIFAIALWDSSSRILLLARDQLGVKPLYVHVSESQLSFASELKALLRNPDVPRKLDLRAVDEHLTFRFTPSPRTLFDGLEKIEPGGLLLWREGRVQRRRYWTPRPRVRTDLSFADAADELRERLRSAVHSQMMSDRPIGVMLSGGVDSAAVVALMAERSSQVKTFTVGFEGGGESDETQLARETSRLFGTDHHELIVGEQDFAAELTDVIAMLEEPVGTSSAVGFRHVARLAHEHVPVLLSGQGADELLAGYWRYVGEWLAGRVLALPPALQTGAEKLAGWLPSSRSARWERGVRALRHPDVLDRFMNIYALFTDEQKRQLYRPELLDHVASGGSTPRDRVQRLRDDALELDELNQMMYVDARLWLPEDLLLVGDKMTMAESVEMRVPFLDQDLVEFLESLPSSFKLRRGRRKAAEKKALEPLLPRNIIHRKERGFITPVDRWLRHEMQPFARELLLSQDSRTRTLFSPEPVQALFDRHTSGTFDHTRQIFSLLSLEIWWRRFL